jgi:hypothetical protein
MGSYYYLIPQLPHLIFGQAPPMSSKKFAELAAQLLNKKDAALMYMLGMDSVVSKSKKGVTGRSYAQSNSASGSDFIDCWMAWERAMRLNLAKYRFAKRREGAAPADPPKLPADAAAIASRAMQEKSPLEGERLIDKARWNAIETLAAGSGYFDRNIVFAYYLKLLILERQASFKTETGFSEYKSLYASIMEQSGTLSLGESK